MISTGAVGVVGPVGDCGCVGLLGCTGIVGTMGCVGVVGTTGVTSVVVPPPPHPKPPVGSVTSTVLVTLPVFPAASTYEYSSVYIHTTHASTNHDVASNITPLPSTASNHVAPGSLYAVPWTSVVAPATSVTTGGV